MAESKVSISSAVILPDEAPISPRATLPTKRRQSSSSDAGSKRPRISTSGSIDGSPKTLRSSPTQTKAESESKPDASIERRKSHVQEEKRRGQRLFGGLINTLSQSSTSGQQKRRLEIEKRQQEKAKQQKVEDEGRKAEKLAKLKEIRKHEQIKFDEKSMRIRHSNMQAMAHFLCTKTEPKLYYKPWELLPADEEHIKKQVADTEALIEREVQEFQTRYSETIQQKEEHEPSESAPAVDEKTNSASAMKETAGESRASDESPSVLPTDRIDSTTNEQATSQQKSDEQARKASLELHNGEVVVEADEDTVIY